MEKFNYQVPLMNATVVIIMGSKSDMSKVFETCKVLNDLGIPFDVRIRSAHRTPTELVELVDAINQSNCQVIIAAAGMSAVLAGSIAPHTLNPVIALPLAGGLEANNQAALTATTQLPPGSGVLTVGLNCTINAALEAAKIVALSDRELRDKLVKYRDKKRLSVLDDDESIGSEIQKMLFGLL